MVLSFSTPTERPAYIGVANTMLAPVAMLGPLLAGSLAEATGYNVLFFTLLLIGLVGLTMLRGTADCKRRIGAQPCIFYELYISIL